MPSRQDRIEFVNDLYIIAKKIRDRKEKGEFSSYQSAYAWASQNMTCNGQAFKPQALKKAYESRHVKVRHALPMMDKSTTVEQFIDNNFISYPELAEILGYSVSRVTIVAWLRGKYLPPIDFVKNSRANKNSIIEYSNNKLKYEIFEELSDRKPRGFWENTSTHRYALEWLCKKCNWNFPYGLYEISLNELKENKIRFLNSLYKNRPAEMVMKILPEYDWKFWFFKHQSKWIHKTFWDIKEQRETYFIWFMEVNNTINPEDWYNVFFENLSDCYFPISLLRKMYNDEVINIAKEVYPSYKFFPWKFYRTPQSFNLREIKNAKYYVETLAKQKGFTDLEDYYQFTKEDFSDTYPKIKKEYGGYQNMLKHINPSYDWHEWKFGIVGTRFWSDKNNLIRYVKWLSNILEIDEYNDWYNITNHMVIANYGDSALKHGLEDKVDYNLNIYDLVTIAYPEHTFDPTKFGKPKKSQARLFDVVKKIFPGQEVLYDKRYKFLKVENGKNLELDIYFPGLKLAFEYNGEQHYKYKEFFHRDDDSLEKQKKYDLFKKEKCKERGIHLVIVDYDWDGTSLPIKDLLKNYSLKSSISTVSSGA